MRIPTSIGRISQSRPDTTPAAVVVELTGFDADTLQHFLQLERPEGSNTPDGDSFVPDATFKREPHLGALMPASPNYQTIGEFYGGIREKIAAFCDVRGEAAIFVGPENLQMRPEEVKSTSVHVVRDLASATAAIDEIVRQGEGSPGDSEESHFAQFGGIQRERTELAEARPGFEPAYTVGRNPVMQSPISSARTHVTHPRAFALIDAGTRSTTSCSAASRQPTKPRGSRPRSARACWPRRSSRCARSRSWARSS